MYRILFLGAGFLGLIFLLALGTKQDIWVVSNGRGLNARDTVVVARQLPVPANLSFCGERVPLDDPDVRERLDYEINLIVYKQVQTVDILKSTHRFFPAMDQVLSGQGIPTDFKYLAIAESALEPTATSPKGAKGVWQFMEATAREYNLEISEEVDERSHIEKSTEAACKYLRSAFNKFSNWTLAAASYNCGMAGLQTQVTQQGEWNYYNLYLNPETARYIYRILAYKAILENPKQYGYYFDTDDYHLPYITRELLIASAGDLPTFARSNGTTYKMLKTLNPWLRKNTLLGKAGKAYSIKLPY